MLFLLSPAKSLDYDTPISPQLPHTLPQFLPQSQALIDILRTQAPQDIASLMSISDKLAALNVARYAAWSPEFTNGSCRTPAFTRVASSSHPEQPAQVFR